MPRFKFIGDPDSVPPNDGPGCTTLGGVTFVKGKFTDVPEGDLPRRLRGNRHFVEAVELSAPVEQVEPQADKQPEQPEPRSEPLPEFLPELVPEEPAPADSAAAAEVDSAGTDPAGNG
jgi:hypothetical protein